jgi:DNA-binding NarL/FixJ family response regulator
MRTTRVLLVGEDPLTRGGVAALLAPERALELAGQAPLDEVPAVLGELRPDVLCWDPGADDLAAGRLVAAAAGVGAPVVALVGAGASGAALLAAGVRGLVDRGARGPVLAAALRAAAAGLLVLEPALAAGWLRAPAPPAGEGEPLTPREREVLALLAEGLGNKAIAARLGVSEHTAKFHVNAILGKLGAASRAEAIVVAARRGLVLL